jgi:hypothetical protein
VTIQPIHRFLLRKPTGTCALVAPTMRAAIRTTLGNAAPPGSTLETPSGVVLAARELIFFAGEWMRPWSPTAAWLGPAPSHPGDLEARPPGIRIPAATPQLRVGDTSAVSLPVAIPSSDASKSST